MSILSVPSAALDGLAILLTPSAGAFAAALAIVVFTMAVRLAISPLSRLQARSARRGAALAPELSKLRERYGDDPLRLATETLAVQRAHGVSPFASLLPALAQAPFFMLMFHLVQPGAGAPTGVLAGHLFGVPLTAHLGAGPAVFAVLIALSLALAWWSARRMRHATPAAARWLSYLPYLGVAAVAWLPLAGGVYLVTSTAWTALEQLVFRR